MPDREAELVRVKLQRYLGELPRDICRSSRPRGWCCSRFNVTSANCRGTCPFWKRVFAPASRLQRYLGELPRDIGSTRRSRSQPRPRFNVTSANCRGTYGRLRFGAPRHRHASTLPRRIAEGHPSWISITSTPWRLQRYLGELPRDMCCPHSSLPPFSRASTLPRRIAEGHSSLRVR